MPTTNSAVTTNLPPQEPRSDKGIIPLPPPAAAVAAAELARGRGWVLFLTLLVVMLAFLSGSFLARNSDLWFHLATGRLLAQGEFSFGADPFAYTTHGVYWACHSWLFDLTLYELYNLIGGTGLVVLKALLVACLAGMLMQVRRSDRAIGVPAACIALAIVAMAPRLTLQSACASYFLFGLTFWLLWKMHVADGRQSAAGDHPVAKSRRLPAAYCLLLLFAVWVNVDEWFLLGPVLAAMFWFGERLRGQKRIPVWLAPAGLAVFLLNPYTYHAFVLPSDLAASLRTVALREDVRFQPIFASPWLSLGSLSNRIEPDLLAYVALTLIGAVSFVVEPHALRGWRVLVFVPFALLAAWHGRAVPFFAIVAAPIAALNWQDYLAERSSLRHSAAWAGYGRLAVRLIIASSIVILMFFTWTGWRVGAGGEGRHVAWAVQAEPSLQRAAEMLRDWRREGRISAEEHIFAVSPDMAQYGAWFAPGEEQFLDHRYPLFAGVAEDYEAVCRALLPGLVRAQATQRGRKADKDWRQVLRQHNVGIVVVSDRDPQRLHAVLERVATNPDEWTLLDIAGQALIIGWNYARPAGGFSAMAFDADRLAFGAQDEWARRTLPLAPDEGPAQLALPRGDRWTRLVQAPVPPT